MRRIANSNTAVFPHPVGAATTYEARMYLGLYIHRGKEKYHVKVSRESLLRNDGLHAVEELVRKGSTKMVTNDISHS
jgi:hypothetical protein